MEIETSPQVVAKKLWNIVRIMFFMLRKGIAKCKVTMEFNLLLKRGKLAAGKAISNTLMLHHHYAAATCRHHHDIPPPGDYEFSCSNSPAFPFHHRRHRRSRHHGHPFGRFPQPCQYDDVSTINNAVQKVLEMLNNSDNKVEASPLVGFGKSPIGKKLRVTDSPFPLKDEGDIDDNQVDMAAEEFIKRFYKNLNLQQKMAAIESPNHNMW